MSNSDVPILVPFEKAYKEVEGPFGRKDWVPDDSPGEETRRKAREEQERLRQNAAEKAAEKAQAKEQKKAEKEQKKTEKEQVKAEKEQKGAQAAHQFKNWSHQYQWKDWADPDRNAGILGGMDVATNAVGLWAGRLNTAGEATRKLMQGILNPGLMGEGAGKGVLGAADTLVTPTKESQARYNNLMNAVETATGAKENADARKAKAAQEQTRKNMLDQATRIAQQAMARVGATDIYKIPSDKQKQFLREYGDAFNTLVKNWKQNGMDPDLIKEAYDMYSSPWDVARKNFEYSNITEPNADAKIKETKYSADQASQTNTALNNVASHVSTNFSKLSQNKDMKWAKGYLDWAAEQGLVTKDANGDLIPSDNSMFIDGVGHTIDSDKFNFKTAKVNFGSNNTQLDRYIQYLDSTGSANDQELAEKLREGKIEHQRNEKLLERKGAVAYYEKVRADERSKSLISAKSPFRGLRKKALTEIRGAQDDFCTDLIERYGTDLSIDQLESLAKNGGLSSKSLDDYDTLKKLYDGMEKERGEKDHLEKLEAISRRTYDEYLKDPSVLPTLSDEELKMYRSEMIFDNLSHKLQAMEKMKNLDGKIDSFNRKLGHNGEKPVDMNGMPIYIRQRDVLKRYRDIAYSEYRDALDALNTDLDEVIYSTNGPSSTYRGRIQVLNKNGTLGVKAYTNDPNDKEHSQAFHLAQMVLSNHSPDSLNNKIGALGDNTIYSKDPVKQDEEGDRRIDRRMSVFFDRMNEANGYLGDLPDQEDSEDLDMVLSDDARIATANADMLIKTVAKGLGFTKEHTLASVMYMNAPKTAVPINPNLVSQYQYGEFSDDDPPDKDDIANIKTIISSLDSIAPGIPPGAYTTAQLNAARQYRAALTMNACGAYLREALDKGNGRALDEMVTAYRKYLCVSKKMVSNAQALTELEQIFTSQQFVANTTALRLATPKSGAPAVLGADNKGYLGRPPAKSSKRMNQAVILSDPDAMVGLANALFTKIST